MLRYYASTHIVETSIIIFSNPIKFLIVYYLSIKITNDRTGKSIFRKKLNDFNFFSKNDRSEALKLLFISISKYTVVVSNKERTSYYRVTIALQIRIPNELLTIRITKKVRATKYVRVHKNVRVTKTYEFKNRNRMGLFKFLLKEILF